MLRKKKRYYFSTFEIKKISVYAFKLYAENRWETSRQTLRLEFKKKLYNINGDSLRMQFFGCKRQIIDFRSMKIQNEKRDKTCNTHIGIRQGPQSFVIFLAGGVPQTHVVF